MPEKKTLYPLPLKFLDWDIKYFFFLTCNHNFLCFPLPPPPTPTTDTHCRMMFPACHEKEEFLQLVGVSVISVSVPLNSCLTVCLIRLTQSFMWSLSLVPCSNFKPKVPRTWSNLQHIWLTQSSWFLNWTLLIIKVLSYFIVI